VHISIHILYSIVCLAHMIVNEFSCFMYSISNNVGETVKVRSELHKFERISVAAQDTEKRSEKTFKEPTVKVRNILYSCWEKSWFTSFEFR